MHTRRNRIELCRKGTFSPYTCGTRTRFFSFLFMGSGFVNHTTKIHTSQFQQICNSFKISLFVETVDSFQKTQCGSLTEYYLSSPKFIILYVVISGFKPGQLTHYFYLPLMTSPCTCGDIDVIVLTLKNGSPALR